MPINSLLPRSFRFIFSLAPRAKGVVYEGPPPVSSVVPRRRSLQPKAGYEQAGSSGIAWHKVPVQGLLLVPAGCQNV